MLLAIISDTALQQPQKYVKRQQRHHIRYNHRPFADGQTGTALAYFAFWNL